MLLACVMSTTAAAGRLPKARIAVTCSPPSLVRTDGTVVREQSIRTSALVQVDGVAIGSPVLRRDVTVDMSASFESIFGVLDAAEGVNQLVTPRSVEIVVMSTALEQAVSGNFVVRATIVFEEWFEQPATANAPANEARR